MPYTASDGKQYKMDFTNDKGLYAITMRMSKSHLRVEHALNKFAADVKFADTARLEPRKTARQLESYADKKDYQRALNMGLSPEMAQEHVLRQQLNSDEKRYLNRLQQSGIDRAESIRALMQRIGVKATYRQLTDLMAAVVIDAIQYGTFNNIEYRGLFRRTAKEIADSAGTKTAVDALTEQGLMFLELAHISMIKWLNGRENVSSAEAYQAIHDIAFALGINVRALENILQVDIATGKPLLKS